MSQESADAIKAALERPELTSVQKAFHEKFYRSKYYEALSSYERYHQSFVTAAYKKFRDEYMSNPGNAAREATSEKIEAIRKARGGQRNIFR